jgi:predicted DCC family thiol-disulfide oxidoreductase YuxK
MDPMIIVFDGVCNFCNGWVRFIIAHDRRRRFQFVAAQSALGRQLMEAAGLSPDALDSVVLVDGQRTFLRSDAILRTLGLIGGWPSAFTILRVLPKIVRDPCYLAFARRRYRLFGRRDVCAVPAPELRDRFLA